MLSNRFTRSNVFAAVMLLLIGSGQASAQETAPQLKAITVSFKFDPGPTYGGPRWVSPPFTSGILSGEATVAAKVEGSDSGGKPIGVKAEWTSADPEMVAVLPSQGAEYHITVKHAGESKLKVSANEVSLELLIKAKSFGKAMQVQISALPTESAIKPAAAHDGEANEKSTVAVADTMSPFKSKKKKDSYALGMNTAGQLRARSLDVDPEVFVQGFKDSLTGTKTVLTEQDVHTVIAALRSEQMQKETERRQALLAARKLQDIKISFRQNSLKGASPENLDSWVSPPLFATTQDTFEAKAEGLSGSGKITGIVPRWTSADPEMVVVSPTDGNAVKISVKRPGESKVTVASRGISKELTVRAKHADGNSIQVEINQ
jgi:hypothetical protein